MNRGDGSFAPAVKVAQPAAPLHLASGDFNRDGRLDVLLTDWSQGVSVLSGNGKGAFRRPSASTSHRSPTACTSWMSLSWPISTPTVLRM